MSSSGAPWTARIVVRTDSIEVSDWLVRALGPEASREVPRARAELFSPSLGTTAIAIEARDGGAMRAALNTYLGWVDLALATARRAVARRPPA